MLVVGANLTIDRTLHLTRLRPGSVQRPDHAVASPGGKAVNVCRAAGASGARTRLVANLPGRMGQLAGDLLELEGHDVVRVATSGEIRSAIIIIEEDLRTTVLNEPGPPMTAADRDLFVAAVAAEAHAEAGADGIVVASGSLPPGPDAATLYASIVDEAHRAGLRIVLDAARLDLSNALAARPDVITPNLSEALTVLGRAPGAEAVEAVEPDFADPRQAAMDAASDLAGLGPAAVLVTAGRHGVAGARRAERFWLDAPPVREVNPIGAGDAFAAGLACGLAEGRDLLGATRRAVATGAASVTSPVAGQVDPELLAELLAHMDAVSCGWVR